MKRMSMLLLAALLTVLLCAGTAWADGSVRYAGQAEKFVFLPGSEHSETDLFPAFTNVLPGDVLKQTIEVSNTSGKLIRIFLRAEPVTEADKDFLDQLTLQVETVSKEIFDAPAGETAGLTKNVLLGGFKQNGKTTLTVTLTVPADLGNEYMGKVGTIPWTFTVEEMNEVTETPKTGDWFQWPVWVASAAVLTVALVLVLKKRKHA